MLVNLYIFISETFYLNPILNKFILLNDFYWIKALNLTFLSGNSETLWQLVELEDRSYLIKWIIREENNLIFSILLIKKTQIYNYKSKSLH